MSETPQHISKVLPDALDAMKQGVVPIDPSLEDRQARDDHEAVAASEAEIARLQELADQDLATDEERRELDERKIDLIASRSHDRIEQAE